MASRARSTLPNFQKSNGHFITVTVIIITEPHNNNTMTSIQVDCCGRYEVASEATPTSTYEKWRQKFGDGEREQLLGIRPSHSRRHASVRSSLSSTNMGVMSASQISAITEATRYGESYSQEEPSSHSSHHGGSSTGHSSRAPSVFKHKLSMKLACVACVVGVPKGVKQDPDESRVDDDEDDEDVEDDSNSFFRGSYGQRDARGSPSVTSREPPSLQGGWKKVRFSSEVCSYDEVSHARARDNDKHFGAENQVEENSLLAILEETERWLGIRDDESSHNSHSRSFFACS